MWFQDHGPETANGLSEYCSDVHLGGNGRQSDEIQLNLEGQMIIN